MSSFRRKYDLRVKAAEKLGILPDEIRNQIPKSSRYNFRQGDYNNVFGLGGKGSFEKDIEEIKSFANDKIARKIYRLVIHIKSVIIKLFGKFPKKVSFSVKERIVKVVQRAREVIPLKKILLFFKLSIRKYYIWADQVKRKCPDSFLSRCFRSAPNQLTRNEVSKMKELLGDARFRFWPLFSVAFYAFTHNIVSACIDTWRKYARILGISSNTIKKKKHRIGIRAERPHQIWHADVTIFKTMDNLKDYIYLLIDNFSRFILSWRVALMFCGEVRLETIVEAREKYLLPVNGERIETTLIVDGGPENNCLVIENYLALPEVSLRKLIALHDTRYSNSMIEAANKVLKYKYFFTNNIPDFNALLRHLEKVIPDYNNERPHCALGGRTPYQALNGISLDKDVLKAQIQDAKIKRIEENRKESCPVCIEIA